MVKEKNNFKAMLIWGSISYALSNNDDVQNDSLS